MPTYDLASILAHADEDPVWLVEDMFAAGQMIVLAGAPGVGKSFLAYTLAISLASPNGLPFLGRRTTPGAVLYFDEENALPDLVQYLRWAWRGCGGPDPKQLRLRLEHFSLAQCGTGRFDYMRKVAEEMQPSLIVVDTVTPCCGLANENDNAEASTAIRALRRVRAASPQSTMLLLKHAKIPHEEDAGLTVRGAKTWLGELDAVVYHTVSPGRPRKDGLRSSRLTPDKVRAFGLRESILVLPHWTENYLGRGLSLSAQPIDQ